MAGFYLGDIEDGVDDGQKVPAALMDIADVVDVARMAKLAFGLALEDFGKADDGVERRPELVAHIGQELRLGAGGQLGIHLGLEQAVGQAFALDGVTHGATHGVDGDVGLDQIVLCALLHRGQRVHLIVMAAQDDDWDGRLHLLEGREPFEIAGIGKREIEKDHVSALASEYLAGIRERPGLGNGVVGPASVDQQLSGESRIARVVLDDEHFGVGAGLIDHVA